MLIHETSARPVDDAMTVRIRYRPPYDWSAMLAHFAARAIDGVETVDGDAYERTIAMASDGKLQRGSVRVTHLPAATSLLASIRFPDVRALRRIVDRLRRVFDVAADVTAIGAHLARDPLLAPLVKARPGLRTPGSFDGFELAVRAVLGQQVTLEAGRKLACQLVRIAGRRLCDGRFVFPTARDVAKANLDALGMPRARKDALRAIAAADPRVFEASGDIAATVARLRTIRGVGDWTAHYIALRAAREPDAFPATDAALLRRAALSAPDLEARAERWRPWRAYAAQHLWTSLTDTAA